MAKAGFDKWLSNMQSNGKYKTKLRLEGNIKSCVTKDVRYINGDYYVNMDIHGNEIYDCIDENKTGVLARRRDILNILQFVYYTNEPEKWVKKPGLYMDGKNENQSADTFDGTLIYLIVMFLLTFFNYRIVGWIAATIFYLTWKSSKYN